MNPESDYTALAGGLRETIVTPRHGGAEAPGRAGQTLRYFGDYVLEHEIARGGMGIVYRVRRHTLNRTVAVKVLRDAALAGAVVDRFRLEAGAAASLRQRDSSAGCDRVASDPAASTSVHSVEGK